MKIGSFQSNMSGSQAILGSFGIMLVLCLVMITVSQVKEMMQTSSCQTNLRYLNIAMQSYLNDNECHYPGMKNWVQALTPYLKSNKAFACPCSKDGSKGYGLNLRLENLSISSVEQTGKTVVFFDAQIPESFGLENLVEYRHKKATTAVVGFADGHIETRNKIPASEFRPYELY